MRIPDALRLSPQQIDPLSWVTRPLVPLTFAALVGGYGSLVTLVTWGSGSRSLADLLAVLLVTAACIVVQLSTGPLRPTFGPRRAVVPLLLGLAGLAVSTWSAMDSSRGVQHWWAPVGLGILIAALAPYSNALQVLFYGVVLTVPTCVATLLAFSDSDDIWTPLASVVIASSSVVVAAIATSLFCFQVARESQRLLARTGVFVAPTELAHDDAARVAEIGTLARLGSRVAPFLQKVADAGEVTDADRALAGQLARRLRSDLVSRANRSWLDSLADDGRIYVVDPDHRAYSLNAAQRSAIRGLVLAVKEDPATDAGSLFIELRGQPDGSTAVALSLDIDLPEGRRVMMLAPYYLALKTTVGEISWDPVQELVRFRVPPSRR